jgi:hypothetical protein
MVNLAPRRPGAGLAAQLGLSNGGAAAYSLARFFMTARIFISYRSADGMDKAVALARELGRQFGDAQVFLDKDDLRGGSAWRSEIGQALAQRPVLLLLMTPQLIEAVDADGKLRIADPADPVRRELESAMAAGAQVIPLICDGLSGPPDASRLPEPFNRIGELTWRKLRAYDWEPDIERLVADLLAFGVEPVGAAVPAPTPALEQAPVVERRRAADAGTRAPVARWLALVAGGALLAGAAFWWLRTPPAPSPVLPAPSPASPASSPASSPVLPPPAPMLPAAPALSPPAAPGPAASPAQARRAPRPPAGVAGRWTGKLSRGEQVTLVVTQSGSRVTFVSEPVPIAKRADWADYRAFWRERFGRDLDAVVYRGDGQFIADPGVAPRIDIALKVHPSPGGFDPIDGGNLSATLSPDARALSGTIWLNSLQAEQPATLRRKL